MQNRIAAVFLALAIAGLQPAVGEAATKPTAEQELLLKKKKKLAAQKEQKAKLSRAQQRRANSHACDSIFECMFDGEATGSSRSIRIALNSGASRTAGFDRSTAKVISWNPSADYAPGSIIVRTAERNLYYVLNGGKARRYKVGVGKEGFQWAGTSRVVAKQEWPEWRPPPEMIKREAEKGIELPELMEGGPENPLGARAMYIGGTLFRIHGTNNAGSIGGAVSSGCIRMMNTDVIDLYDRVKVGARVYVYQ